MSQKETLEMFEEPDEDDVDEELDATYIYQYIYMYNLLIVTLGQMRTLVMNVGAR